MATSEMQAEMAKNFEKLLNDHFSSNCESDPLKLLKTKAWTRFQQIGLPSRSSENYRYIHLRSLFSQSYALSIPSQLKKADIARYICPEASHSYLVFVDGHFQPSLSDWSALPDRIVISPLQDAIRTFGGFINQQWTHLVKEESDSFAILNAALHRDGTFIYIPPKTVLNTPIQIINLLECSKGQLFVSPRIHLFMGAQTEAKLINSVEPISKHGYCLNQVVDIALEEDASLHYIQNSAKHHAAGWHFDAVRAQLKKNARLTTILATEGAATERHDYRIALIGENAEARLNGVWMLKDKKEAHVHILVDHQAPNCRSMQLFKTALDDFSRSSFEGKILVRQAAQKTEAFQLNQNLILSDRAHVDSKPNLEIFADDVKASHGATVGQLDTEQLLYMQARGLNIQSAKNLLLHSYCREVIDLIPIPSLQSRLIESLP